MKSRSNLVVVSVVVALILLSGACSAGFLAGRVFTPASAQALIDWPIIQGRGQATSEAGTASDNSGSQDIETLFKAFWQTWDLVHEQYVDRPVDDEALMRGAIKGMLESLNDEHTAYMDPTQYNSLNSELSGEYEGIGAWVDAQGEYLKIISPMSDSPAEKAGLKAGDEIIGVDGEDVTGQDGMVVLQKVKGPKGTSVTLTIRREGMEEPFDVTVTRSAIVVPSVEGEILEGNIAYVQLSTFGEDTTKELRKVLKELLAEKPAGLILDLRNNGGGYLETGVDVASEFIKDGVILYEDYGEGRRETFNARDGGLATEIPMVVLINQGSASASEIVAGAIRDHERGQLVGATSFGKGSVQIFTPLVDDQGAVRVTIARWLTPNGDTIHQKGLEPDIPVEITEEDVKADRDPQLEKAVEALLQGNP